MRDWLRLRNMEYGFLVPLVSGFLIYRRIPALRGASPRTTFAGLALIVWAAAQAVIGRIAGEQFTMRSAVVITIAGTVLFLAGWQWLRVLGEPIALLFFMVPLSAIVSNIILSKFEFASSLLIERGLGSLAVSYNSDGGTFEFVGHHFFPAFAGCGPEELLFLALAYGLWRKRSRLFQVTLVAALIVSAVLVNAARVIASGYAIDRSQQWSAVADEIPAWVMTIAAFLLMLAFDQALRICRKPTTA